MRLVRSCLGLLALAGLYFLACSVLRSLAFASSPPGVTYHITMDVSSSRVIGPPSLSPAFVDRVLSAYHSPAVGLGQALYVDSQHFQLDDAVALAFFLHESSFGSTGVARFTHSLGNLICSGYPTCFQGFRSYPTFQAGAWDWYRLIFYEYLPRGLSTVQSIIPVYAPASAGNNVNAYIAAVCSAVSAWHAGRLWVSSEGGA